MHFKLWLTYDRDVTITDVRFSKEDARLSRPTLESLEIKYIMTNVIIGMNVLGYEVS